MKEKHDGQEYTVAIPLVRRLLLDNISDLRSVVGSSYRPASPVTKSQKWTDLVLNVSTNAGHAGLYVGRVQ